MALELIGGGIVGAVIGELLKAVLDARQKASAFHPALTRLELTLKAIAPRLDRINHLNCQSSSDMEELLALITNGTALVVKCSKISTINLVKKVRYSKELFDLDNSLVRYFITILPLDHLKDTKEILVAVKRLEKKLAAIIDGGVCNQSESSPGKPKEEDLESCEALEAMKLLQNFDMEAAVKLCQDSEKEEKPKEEDLESCEALEAMKLLQDSDKEAAVKLCQDSEKEEKPKEEDLESEVLSQYSKEEEEAAKLSTDSNKEEEAIVKQNENSGEKEHVKLRPDSRTEETTKLSTESKSEEIPVKLSEDALKEEDDVQLSTDCTKEEEHVKLSQDSEEKAGVNKLFRNSGKTLRQKIDEGVMRVKPIDGGAIVEFAMGDLLREVNLAIRRFCNFYDILIRIEDTVMAMVTVRNLRVLSSKVEALTNWIAIFVRYGQRLSQKCFRISSINFVKKALHSKDLREFDDTLMFINRTCLTQEGFLAVVEAKESYSKMNRLDPDRFNFQSEVLSQYSKEEEDAELSTDSNKEEEPLKLIQYSKEEEEDAKLSTDSNKEEEAIVKQNENSREKEPVKLRQDSKKEETTTKLSTDSKSEEIPVKLSEDPVQVSTDLTKEEEHVKLSQDDSEGEAEGVNKLFIRNSGKTLRQKIDEGVMRVKVIGGGGAIVEFAMGGLLRELSLAIGRFCNFYDILVRIEDTIMAMVTVCNLRVLSSNVEQFTNCIATSASYGQILSQKCCRISSINLVKKALHSKDLREFYNDLMLINRVYLTQEGFLALVEAKESYSKMNRWDPDRFNVQSL